MKSKLNCSPHLKMDEITKKLFNEPFLADIHFIVDDKIIYAHSFELMKRSEVFQEQLEETWGAKKLIPITGYKYESFLEFIRFLYTDECIINDDNGIELLKLAVKYHVIILENLVINLLYSREWRLQLFEYCVLEKYEIARKHIGDSLARYFDVDVKSKVFLSLHPDTINEILQFDRVAAGVTEIQIFNALANWIRNYCNEHQISLSDGRERFDCLVTKIRFPTMSLEDIRTCVKNHPELLNASDCMLIGQQIILDSDVVNNGWISKRRGVFEWPFKCRSFNRNTSFETKFCVLKDTYLHGFRIGYVEEGVYEIEITEHDIHSKESNRIQFTQTGITWRFTLLISLGRSMWLRPNFEYTITVTYPELVNIYCRKENEDLLYNDPDNSVKFIKASCTMMEMIFKSPFL